MINFTSNTYTWKRIILSFSNKISRDLSFTWVKNLSPINVSEEETISLKEYKALQKKMKDLEIENEILKRSLKSVY